VATVLGTALAIGVVTWLFLSLYTSRHYATPIAQDTLKYIWRTKLTELAGFGAIVHVPAGTTVQPDRPGFPAMAALVHSTLGVSPFRLAFVVAPVAAVMVGLAAATLMVRATREPRWSFPVYLLGVGASMNVVLMAVGYLDNLVAAGVLVAAAVCGLLAADGRRGIVATALLLCGATIIHWQFTALFVAVLLGVVVLLVPESFRAWRRGGSPLQTPAARLAAGLLGAVAGAGLILLETSGPANKSNRGSFLHKVKVASDYRFGVVGPLSVAGVAAVAVPPASRRLRTLALLVVWGLSAPAAYVALKSGLSLPAHRVIAFALAIPILATAAVVGAVRGGGRLLARIRGRAASPLRVIATVAAGAVLVVALVVSTAVSRSEWFGHAHPALVVHGFPSPVPTQADAIAEASRAAAYVARDGHGLPVIYVARTNALAVAASAMGIVRVAIPPDQIPRTALYVGIVQRLLEGHPTLAPRGGSNYNRLSLKFWAGAKEFADRAIIIELRSFDRRLATKGPEGLPGQWIAKGVWLVRGPPPTAPVPDIPPPTAPSPLSLVLAVVGVLALFAAAGSGWGAALLDDAGARIALAPAFGVVVLALGGVLVDHAGLRLRGVVGVAVAVVVAAGGWAVFLLGRRASRRRQAASPGRSDSPTNGSAAGEKAKAETEAGGSPPGAEEGATDDAADERAGSRRPP
jgi:hypothetical protein